MEQLLDINLLSWYISNIMEQKIKDHPGRTIERVQTGVRIERRTLKVLKGLAELKDISLGDLLEGICLHAFEGKQPFDAQTQKQIGQLKQVYGLDLSANDSHRLFETEG